MLINIKKPLIRGFLFILIVVILLLSFVGIYNSYSQTTNRENETTETTEITETDNKYKAYYFRGEFHYTYPFCCFGYSDDPQAVDIPYEIYYFESAEEMYNRYRSRLCSDCYPREANKYN